jgi:hypothetical protein
MIVTERWTDSKERQAPRLPPSPQSAFLWAGMVCLLASALVGVGAIGNALQHRDASPRQGLTVALGLLGIAVVMLYAQTRYRFWRRTAGVIERHPLMPDTLWMQERVDDLSLRRDLVIGLALALAAAAPRMVVLFHSLWQGELRSLARVTSGPAYVLMHRSDGSNHLLYWLLAGLCWKGYALLFGTAAASGLPPAWLLRLPAFAFGAAAVPVLYLAAREPLGRPAAAAAGLLLAFSPAAVAISGQARGYSLLLFFTVAQAYWLQAALRKSAASSWLWWLACAALGAWAHLACVCVIGVTALFLLAYSLWTRRYLLNPLRAAAIAEQGGAMLLAWALLTAIAYAGVWEALSTEAARAVAPSLRAQALLAPLLQLWGGAPQGDTRVIYDAACGMFALLGVWYLVQRPSGATLYLPLLLLAPFAVAELAQPHLYSLSAFAFALPAFLALLAGGMEQFVSLALGTSAERAVWRLASLYLLACLFLLITLPGLRQALLAPAPVSDWPYPGRDAASDIALYRVQANHPPAMPGAPR